MHCEECVKHVTSTLKQLDGIQDVDCDLKSQLVSVVGSTPPSQIVKAIQTIGKDAIVRGTGKPDSAAVCILESFEDDKAPVKGLARIVAISSNQALFDITVNGLPKGTYFPSVRESGDLSNGPLSTGKELISLGDIQVNSPLDNKDSLLSQNTGYSGQAFVRRNVSISDLIGRSMTLSAGSNNLTKYSLVGVIARSAGAWENTKTVCSCSGKTLWEERSDAVVKGIN